VTFGQDFEKFIGDVGGDVSEKILVHVQR
jgi:hypothetical protein